MNKNLFNLIIKNTFVGGLLILTQTSQGQNFTQADTLRGSLTSPFRTCYDINYYHLDIKVAIDKKFISGSNQFNFTANTRFKTLQFDLFANMHINKVVYNNAIIPFTRVHNAVFITFPDSIKAYSKQQFTVYYSGNPTLAKNAPWEGGFVFSSHNNGNPWVATACQGIGASLWWPNKDQQADEVDSMLISLSVANNLMAVSNGKLRNTTILNDNHTQYNWFVANPINNYGVALNIANYAKISESYHGINGALGVDFYVLPQNVEKAKTHLTKNVKQMLEAFEYWFGPYPFYTDGYKMVETPFLGMEHQSCVAYGNNYLNGYASTDLSHSGWGLKWDFIAVHESGHEWWGNNITAKDIADMWIHESFTNYSEGLFTEYWYGKPAGKAYILGLRKNIRNDKPIIGTYGVNNQGSADMYYKGANMLHTIRTIINNDNTWKTILKGLNTQFAKQTVTTQQIIHYINTLAKYDFTPVFNQYLMHNNIPVLQYKIHNGLLFYRYKADVKSFNMPIEIVFNGIHKKLYPTLKIKKIPVNKKVTSIQLSDNYYVVLGKM
ncbi:MAG: M1 family peptidase [Sphingobacteriales bacterium]|nr:MAG: M1 family peptidase [Sphingobacteriales bacterium]TAF80590.1 MAG: M1 family peptidase [Sphingobacteriales bacterium]